MICARVSLFVAVAVVAAGCGGDREKVAADSAKAAAVAASKAKTLADAPTPGITVTGFKHPESVLYDSLDDAFFVTNINGDPSAKDGNGFISRLRGDGSIDSLMFIAGGRNGVTLNGPKGSALVGDTIWVADIDAMRAFNKRTGAVVATVDLKKLGAEMLNDVAVGPDGSIYVTDTGPGFVSTATKGNRIFRIARNHKPSVAVHSDSLASPNGITWDPGNQRFIIVQFGGKRIVAWKPGDKTPRTIGIGAAQSDGVALLADGRLIFTSWAEKALIIHHHEKVTTLHGFESPADFGVDTRRHRLVIPLLMLDKIEFWDIPPVQP